MSDLSPQEHVDARVRTYYGSEFDEADRLVGRSGQGLLEFERTQEYVTQRVPAGSRIIDIGGAAGRHSAALAERGDTVLLIDPVPRHVQAALGHGTFAATLGDARAIPADADSFDAALMLGPLYHLVDRRARLRAWAEAIRVVRPGGWVFAAGISRLSALAWVTVIGPSIQRADGVAAPDPGYAKRWRLLIEEGAGALSPTASPAATSTSPTTSSRRRRTPGCSTSRSSASKDRAPRRSRSAGLMIRHSSRRRAPWPRRSSHSQGCGTSAPTCSLWAGHRGADDRGASSLDPR